MSRRWVRGSVALLMLAACSSSSPSPDAADASDGGETGGDGGLWDWAYTIYADPPR